MAISNMRNLMQYAPYATAFGGNVASGSKRNRGYRSGRTETLVTRKPVRRQIASSFRSKVESIKPAKHLSLQPGATVLHNEIFTLGLTQQIFQGDGNDNRDGDAVVLCALKIKNAFFSSTVAGAYQFRMIVGYSGEEYTANNYTTTRLTTSELFLPSTFSWPINGIINPKAFTCLYDETIDINSQVSGASDIKAAFMNVDLGNHHFNYQSSASIYGKTKNLYVVLIGCVVGGVSGVSTVGTCNTAVDLIFK